jgi:hypothetical protein
MLTAILTDYAFIEDQVVNCSDDLCAGPAKLDITAYKRTDYAIRWNA